jgi:hypothetical protein
MKNNKYLWFYTCIFLVPILFQSAWANKEAVIPDISGEWAGLNENGEETEVIIAFSQDGKHLEGTFVDSDNGKIIIEAPISGFIDVNGNVIFDIYFGQITSTNRLKLSSDKNMLDW